jgi:hypothetical protein
MRRTLRPLAALAVIAMIAVISAGCGGTSTGGAASAGVTNTTPSTATASSTLTARDKAVKFTECMRANGVSDFPDPNASGEFPNFGVSVSGAQWLSALRACKALQPPGSLSAKLTPKQFSTAIKFAQCMRAKGVPDFPDPVNGQPLIDTNKIPSSNRPGGMTILNATAHKCSALLRAAMAGH